MDINTSQSAISIRPRLLFVDDDPGVLAAVTRFLRRYRFDVVTASGGDAGLVELVSNGPFQVVVSDYRMSGMGGEEFLRKVADISPETRRVILSAYTDSDLLMAAINAGWVHRYLTKPWDSRELLVAIRQLADEYRQIVSEKSELQELASRNIRLADTNRQLEEVLSSRTVELEAQGRQLQESNQRLRMLSAHLEQVREEERRAIARDIHDDLGQTLTAMNLEVASILRNCDSSAISQRLKTLKQQIDAAIGTVQRIISVMRPQVLDELGLEAAMQGLAQMVRETGGINCVLSCSLAGEPLSQAATTCLYRIAQESLTNVLRHSGAGKALVTLRRRDSWCQLQVRDNGVGISEERAIAADAFGLMGMRERVTQCGGSFSISPRAGGGTIVEVQIPDRYGEQL